MGVRPISNAFFCTVNPTTLHLRATRRGMLMSATLLLAACGHFQPSSVARVGDKEVEYLASNGKGPPVIFENGLGGSIDWWQKVYPRISSHHTAVLYHRMGYGKSSEASTPRDGQHIVEELRTFLKMQNIQPPYVLVGHSVGGLYAQYHARKYPQDVRALVLVDSTHPQQMQGKGAPEHWPSTVKIAMNLATSAVEKNELLHINATGEAVLALPMPTHIPVWILAAKKDQDRVTDDAYVQDTQEKRLDLLRMYPQAKIIWVDSGHGIPLEKPDAVIDAVLDALK